MSFFTQKETETIQQNAAGAEQAKYLSAQVLDVIYKYNLLKLFVPKELGGREETLPTALKVFEECAYVDGTVGWLAAIGSGGNYFVGYYNASVAKQLFSGEKAVLAGSGYTGVARKTEGGYIVSGHWKYCSGAGFATFYTASAVVDNGAILSFTFVPEQVTVIKDWDAFGLKATESYSIEVNEAFVPDELVFDLSKPPVSYTQNPVYSFPFMLFAQYSFAAVVLGLYRAFVNGANQLNKQYSDETSRNLAIKQLLQKADVNLEKYEQALHKSAQNTWDAHISGKGISEALMVEGAEAVLSLSAWAPQMASNIFAQSGMAMIMENNPLNRIYRNLLTANQHILLRKY